MRLFVSEIFRFLFECLAFCLFFMCFSIGGMTRTIVITPSVSGQ
jgi:hypothetical protein